VSTERLYACQFTTLLSNSVWNNLLSILFIFSAVLSHPEKVDGFVFLFSEAFSFIFCSNWTLKRFTVKYWFGIRRRPENAESQIISWVTVTTRFTMLQLLRLQLRRILLCRKDKNKHQNHVLISLMNLTIGNYTLTLTSRVEGWGAEGL
jgi:hypothetical protein